MPIDLRDQYFGTEIEMTGITRQRAAQVVAEMFGTDYYHRISYKNVREHLLKNLEGDRAWRYDKSQYACLQQRNREQETR